MRKRLWLAVAMFAVMAPALAAQQPALTPKALAGRWEGQRPAEDRVNVIVLSLRVSGDSVAGTVTYNGQEFGDLESASIKDNVLSFTVNDIVGRGVVKGETMDLALSTAERDLWSVVLTRKPAAL